MCKVARAKQPYDHRSDMKSFLQRQTELIEERDHAIDRVELFQEMHTSRTGEFVSLVVENTSVSL